MCALSIERLPSHLHEFRNDGSWRDQTLGEAARECAMSTPDAEVFLGGGPACSFASLTSDAEALAVSLLELGLRRGDVISFQLPNWHEAAVINLAAALTGLIISPIIPIYRDAEVSQMLADSGSRLIFLTEQFRAFDYAVMMGRIRSSLSGLDHVVFVRGKRGAAGYDSLVAAGRGRTLQASSLDPDAVKLLLYTSGTTGRPKGVLHSQNTLTRVVEAATRHWRIMRGDVILMPSPITHVSGYIFGIELPFLSGTRTVLMESWNAEKAVEIIDRYGIVGTVAATPFLRELVDAARAVGTGVPSLRFFACGGAAVPPDAIREANAAFVQPCAFRVFGCSEAPLITLGFLGADRAELGATTDGEVIDYQVRVVDLDGKDVKPGVEGEILARGPAMFLGYAEANQTRDAITPDGYYRTGDMGLVTLGGAILITGRIKDLIIRGGENISAKEIEDVLHRHPAVAEAAVVSMPHARLGEGVCAYVVLRDGMSMEESALAVFIAEQGLAMQKCPERVEFVAELPKTASGKIRKDRLRAEIRARVSLPRS